MLHDVTGDILLSKAAAIVHGVAPNDDFHSGLALALREKFPAMYKDFRHYCQTSHPKEGELWSWGGAGQHGAIRIISLFTQDGAYGHGGKPGRARVEHVNHALRALRALIDQEHVRSLALPKLATGVGGLKWEDVQPLIKNHLGGLKTPVFIYTTYQKGAQAVENGA